MPTVTIPTDNHVGVLAYDEHVNSSGSPQRSYMASVDLLYYLAGGFTLLMAQSRTLLRMRMLSITAGIFFVAYGFAVQVWPVVILNGGVALVHTALLCRGYVVRPSATGRGATPTRPGSEQVDCLSQTGAMPPQGR